MSRVLLLGPGAKGSAFALRLRWREALQKAGHHAVLLERVRGRTSEDLAAKLLRTLIREGIDTVVVYWPAGAQMQSVYDELLLLRVWSETRTPVQVYLLHHENVLRVFRDGLRLLEPGRSRYLDSIERLHPVLYEWGTAVELEREFDTFLQQLS